MPPPHRMKVKAITHTERLARILGTICVVWFVAVWWKMHSILDQTLLLRDHHAAETSVLDLAIKKRRGQPHAFAEERKRRAKKPPQDPQSFTTADNIPHDNNSKSISKKTNRTRYIVFRPIKQGQGMGNIVNGLLAVHLFGQEFDRVVCSPTYHAFHKAFTSVDANTIEACSRLPSFPKEAVDKQQSSDDNLQSSSISTTITALEFHVINYEPAPDECALQRKLASDEPIVYILANTYPRWRNVPDRYFEQLYTPTRALQAFLPKLMPKTVVHLRKGDQGGDKRRGLDNETFAALGKALPSDTYLVTNQLTWYDFFSDTYGWRHPTWHAVQHSAARAFMWAEWGNATDKDKDNHIQTLQMWSDWYAMAQANLVWHTHSDFSLSAIHWMNVSSKTIQGVDQTTGELILEDEAWRKDPPMLPLKDRGPNDIKNCKPDQLELVKAELLSKQKDRNVQQ